MDNRESWITTSSAMETAEKAVETLIEELRGLESMASEAAALLEKSGKDVGDWEEEKQINRSIMIALAGRNLRKDLGQSRWDSSSHEAAPEREAVQLRRAIRAYQTVGRREQDVWWLEGEYAAPVRGLLGPFEDGTITAGDEVEWDDGADVVSGRVMTIAHGVCAIGQMTRWRKGGGGSSCEPLELKNVSDLRKHIRY